MQGGGGIFVVFSSQVAMTKYFPLLMRSAHMFALKFLRCTIFRVGFLEVFGATLTLVGSFQKTPPSQTHIPCPSQTSGCAAVAGRLS